MGIDSIALLFGNWLKVKRFEEYDGFVSGFKPGESGSAYENLVGTLEISVYLPNGDPYVIASISAIPLGLRRKMTKYVKGKPVLKDEFYYKVLTVRGQDWTKNMKLSHAVPVVISENADESMYFRSDKNPEDCVLDIDAIRKKTNLKSVLDY